MLFRSLLAKLKELKEEFRGRWQEPVAELGQWLRSVVQGYFKLPRRAREPSQSQQFSAGGEQALVRALRRRGQKHPMTWARFAAIPGHEHALRQRDALVLARPTKGSFGHKTR